MTKRTWIAVAVALTLIIIGLANARQAQAHPGALAILFTLAG